MSSPFEPGRSEPAARPPLHRRRLFRKYLLSFISVIAAATCEKPTDDPISLLADIPSFYMNKISYGPRVKSGPGRIRIDNSVQDNLEIIRLLCDVTLRIVEGEIYQLTKNGSVDLSEEEHFDIVRRKTAYLFAGCARIGGMLGPTTREQQEALRIFLECAHEPVGGRALREIHVSCSLAVAMSRLTWRMVRLGVSSSRASAAPLA